MIDLKQPGQWYLNITETKKTFLFFCFSIRQDVMIRQGEITKNGIKIPIVKLITYYNFVIGKEWFRLMFSIGVSTQRKFPVLEFGVWLLDDCLRLKVSNNSRDFFSLYIAFVFFVMLGGEKSFFEIHFEQYLFNQDR